MQKRLSVAVKERLAFKEDKDTSTTPKKTDLVSKLMIRQETKGVSGFISISSTWSMVFSLGYKLFVRKQISIIS